MTQKDEALRMAITYFEILKEPSLLGNPVFTEIADWVIEKCKAALSEPEQVSLPDGGVAVPVEILNEFPEINLSNYGDDEVRALNNWGIEVVGFASAPKLNTKD